MGFEDISEHSHAARSFDEKHIVMNRQDHNGRWIGSLRQTRGCLQAGKHRHRDIEDNEIRLESGYCVERSLTVADCSDDFEFGSTKQIDEPFEHDWVIIGQEYPNTSRHCPTPYPCSLQQGAIFWQDTRTLKVRLD
jgi:hypothetical protein